MTAPARLATALADRYRIVRQLGEGGMATVFLAEDLKHHRQVAVKVLRPELSALLGAERFLKEIELTANMQHPHLLPLFDSGEAAGQLYYVMPYVAGESLRDKLTRETQFPIDEAVRITTQVAGALDYAHRRGIIHRDIKPENILLHEGQALIADFGIALALRQAGGNRLTETGLSLGTPQYMSPEQATGERALDARSDIYSLACVLYEMLVGEPPHTGPTVQAVIARVVADEPRSLSGQRKAVPPSVEDAVMRALEKLPADRFTTAAEFATALVAPEGGRASVASRGARRAPRRTGRWLAGVVLLFGIGTAAGVLAARLVRPAAPADDVIARRTSIILPDSVPLAYVGEAPGRVGRRSLALSSDGRMLAYVGWYRGRTHLFLRPLDEERVRRVEGTEGAYSPFFSPNGRWVAFFAQRTLKKVAVDGGAPIELANAPEVHGGLWLPNGRILFGKNDGLDLTVVSENGGAAMSTAVMARYVNSPSALPGSDYVLATTPGHMLVLSMSDSVPRLLAPSGSRRAAPAAVDPVLSGASNLQFLLGGYLVVAGDGRLHALPFSVSSLQSLGPLVPLDEQVRQEVLGSAQFALGGEGSLIYAPGGNVAHSLLVVADRHGRVDTLPFERAEYWNPAYSPDGRRVAVTVHVPGGTELRVLDLASASRIILASWRGLNFDPAWSADGSRILFRFDDTAGGTAEVLASGGEPRPAREVPGHENLFAMSRDGSLKLLAHSGGLLGADSGGYYVSGPGQGTAQARGSAVFAAFSPDNRWLLWSAVGTRGYELFVSALPLGGPVYSVTPDGCLEGYWMPDSREIVCFRTDGYLYSVPLTFERGEVRGGRPRRLTNVRLLETPGRTWTLSPDGQRMLFVASPPHDSATVLTVVTNFRRVVERKLAEAQRQGRP